MREPLAYQAMFAFLEDRYKRLPSDELGALLGELSLTIWQDGEPGDPAIKAEWERAWERVLEDAAARDAAVPLRRAG